MKGQREYLDYLQDILDATRKARRFVPSIVAVQAKRSHE